MGLERNVPRNILQYRSERDFVAVALNPQAYRSRSAMPAMQHLWRAKIAKIAAYVGSMAERKVCISPQHCANYIQQLR